MPKRVPKNENQLLDSNARQQKCKVVVLASGSGSNFQALIDYAQNPDCHYEIVGLIVNIPEVYALGRALNHNIPCKTIDIIDVGGGFPLQYRGMDPVPLGQYMQLIAQKFETMPVTENCLLWCEPGRALVGDGTSIITRVELVKGDMVYINDGAYGNLFDGAHVNWPYDVTHIRIEEDAAKAPNASYKIYGPTCDGIDALNSEYQLPANIKEGDYIEFHTLGAYGVAMATKFNGFGATQTHIANDDPQFSMFGAAVEHITNSQRF